MKTALVTGGARRIGRAMALNLAARGYDVAVHYAQSAAEAEEVVSLIAGLGRRGFALQADLLDPLACEALVGRAAAALGPLSVLVNNASIFEEDTILTATHDSWERHIGSNLRAPYLLTQGFARQCPPALVQANGEMRASGLVVNMIDQRVWHPSPDHSTYTIAKMALWALTRTAAQGLAPQIRVNAIGPGPVLMAEGQGEAAFDAERRGTILRRGVGEEDITAALGYLIDSPAVTGQMIAVDGGQHLGWQGRDPFTDARPG
ncbi:SDR family oxidoreductase [Xinfangfangia sp. D13-10-4-6]|uniref:SDR family oxidoreductase n=1 Tax=Pseudogemmobacter hezensis TaxID=2737662 RepID=UPI001554E3D6|nr:SDR family oxidoreductase [Pseudogemmobacter hezensis]NPD13778.1 SDR family oxidoreductase [Pseudogemmobacter hezensis]